MLAHHMHSHHTVWCWWMPALTTALFGCTDCIERLSHYFICPKLFSLCEYLDRDISIHPTSRIGLCNPDKGVLFHMCCVFSWYQAIISHVKLNHDTFATDNQRMKLSIKSAQKTYLERFCWSHFCFSSWFSDLHPQILTCCNGTSIMKDPHV